MQWPIDGGGDEHPADRVLGPGLGEAVRRRLLLERSIARRFGFECFADYYADRRRRGWGLNRLTAETGQTRHWVRGVMRRYPDPGPGAFVS